MAEHSDMPPKSVSRRDMLIYAGAALAAAALPLSYVLHEQAGTDPAPALLAALEDPASIALLGAAWRGDAAAHSMARSLAKRLAPFGWKPEKGAEGLKQALAARIRQDFQRGDMVDIMGWQVSRTAAELAALAAAHKEG